MTGLYQRRISPNTTSPAMTVDKSQGAGGAVPRGASVSMPQQEQGVDAAQLGGLLGMIKNGMAGGDQNTLGLPNPDKSTGGGIAYNPSPSSNGEWGGVQLSAYGPGIPTGATGQYEFPGAAASAASMTNPMSNAVSSTLGKTAQGMALNFDPSMLSGVLGNMGGFGA